MLDISSHFPDVLNLPMKLPVELVSEGLTVERQAVCRSLLHLLGGLVNKPGLVLTMKLLKILQLNSSLFFPGPPVQSLQTNLKGNDPRPR